MTTDAKEWPFKDARSTAVFTSKSVARGETWIQFVSHDAEDGAWQFHPQGVTSRDKAWQSVTARG